MQRGAPPDLFALRDREREGIRAGLGLDCNAVPQVADELQTLVETQVEKFGNSQSIHTERVPYRRASHSNWKIQ